eukprot:TRINITY_DN10993_c0_g1_i1.p1 TRINITY_DN10993_c0_g1~~TRINITY_DN10993_c0_g1_i1.p1  ORF type:complete len:432 (-),score=148.37 TRINITY_DN10993_c0_g1_i1:73-1368(-)
MITAITKKVTRSSSAALMGQIHDENKANMGKPLIAEKKAVSTALPGVAGLGVAKRGALVDISNVGAAAIASAAHKVEKKPIQLAVVPQVSTAAALASRARVPIAAPKPAVVVETSRVTRSASSSSLSSALAPAPVVPLPVEAVPAPVAKQADVVMADSDEEEEDIDMFDVTDPQCCTEYVTEIFEYCRKKEAADAVSPYYMSKQTDINEKMRAILIDWMVEVNIKFKLLTETMFLSVNLVDRFLALKPVSRNKLQLVGVTAMLLASKYEEIYPPEVRDFIYISDKAYAREEILSLERLMLSTLSFNLSVPTPLHFLRRFSKAARSDSAIHTLSKYLTELSLPEYRMIHYLPSTIAAAAVYLARRMSSRTPYWTPTLIKYTCYREEEIIACARELNTIVAKSAISPTLKATYAKYKSDKLLAVAKVPAAPEF